MDVAVGGGVGVAVEVGGMAVGVVVAVGVGGDVADAVAVNVALGWAEGEAVGLGSGGSVGRAEGLDGGGTCATALAASVGGCCVWRCGLQAARSSRSSRDKPWRRPRAGPVIGASVVDQRAFDTRTAPTAIDAVVAAYRYAQVSDAPFMWFARNALQVFITTLRANVFPKEVRVIDAPAQAANGKGESDEEDEQTQRRQHSPCRERVHAIPKRTAGADGCGNRPPEIKEKKKAGGKDK